MYCVCVWNRYTTLALQNTSQVAIITNKGKITECIKIQNIKKAQQVYWYKINIENVFLNTSKGHLLKNIIFKERFWVLILEMAVYYWTKHPAESIIRNLELCILKVIFSGIRKLPRHWGIVEPRHGRVGNHREVSPACAPMFILKFCVDSKHQFKG